MNLVIEDCAVATVSPYSNEYASFHLVGGGLITAVGEGRTSASSSCWPNLMPHNPEVLQ